MIEKVFVVATASITSLGEQQRLISAEMFAEKKVEVPVEDHLVPYYALKEIGALKKTGAIKNAGVIEDVQLNKSFALMTDLLVQQVEQLLSKFSLNQQQLKNTMLFLGSTSLDIGCISPDDDKNIWLSQTDKLSQYLVDFFGFHSIHFTFNTACTASANALIYATNFIKQQKIEQAIVVGCEFFNQLSLNGFDSLDLISATAVKPFASSRDGLILGEGVGAVLLSKYADEQTQFEILGGYSSCDDHSLTITEEQGAHIIAVINKALENASISKSDVDLIKVHGTASIKSDLAEANALQQLFQDIPKVIALKSLIGHTLGACGVIELALMEQCVKYEILPNFPYQDLEQKKLELPFVCSVDSLSSSKIMLFNHFGFGGNNAALIIKRVSCDS